MKWRAVLSLGLTGQLWIGVGWAQSLWPTMTHPLGWTQLAPWGELPGWTSNNWLDFEVTEANVWNDSAQFTHVETGKALSFQADYEQTTLNIQWGTVLMDRIGFQITAPVAFRHGGILDPLIDGFHEAFDFERFNRELSPSGRNILSVTSDGVEKVNGGKANSGFSNIVLSMKAWIFKLGESCPCGFSISVLGKIPLRKASSGLSSGRFDAAGLVSFALPLWKNGYVAMNSSLTYSPSNPLFEDWPRKKWYWMAELTMRFPITNQWSILLGDRYESAYMSDSHLQFNPTSSDPVSEYRERISSGWYALAKGRNYLLGGVLFQLNPQWLFSLMILEDISFGSYESYGSKFTVSNAPDLSLTLKAQFHF